MMICAFVDEASGLRGCISSGCVSLTVEEDGKTARTKGLSSLLNRTIGTPPRPVLASVLTCLS